MSGVGAMSARDELIERLRILLTNEASVRDVSMFGGRSFMINEKMAVSALAGGDLLVRIDASRHDELVAHHGAAGAEMGAGRVMGTGWIAITAEAIAGDEGLAYWLGEALDYNRSVTLDARVGDKPATAPQ